MDIESSSVNSAKTTALANQEINQTAVYGKAGGSPYVCSLGHYVTSLTTYTGIPSGGFALYGIEVAFDTGETVLIGNTTSTSASIDLTSDSISKMYVLEVTNTNVFAGNGLGCGAIYIETVRGQKFSSYSGYTPANYKGNWNLVSSSSNQPCQNIVLTGLKGNSGSAVDSLSFLYKNDVLMTRVVENFVYSNWNVSDETPINVASAIVSNQTPETQKMAVRFEKSVSSSYSWSVSAGVMIGVSASFNTGIPFVAEAEVTTTVEVSFTATFGQNHSVSEAFSYDAAVSVPSNTTIQANATASSYTINGAYTATYAENWAHAGAVTQTITGTIQGLCAYNVVVNYTEVATPSTAQLKLAAEA